MFPAEYEVNEIIVEEFEDGDQDGMHLSYDEIDTVKVGTVTVETKEENDDVDSLKLLDLVTQAHDVPNGAYITGDDISFDIFAGDHKPIFRLILL